jgi:indolepyruvate ferredoxin oxidoreductase
VPLFRTLRRMRGLRGTAFDPVGYAHVRRVERELIGEYRALVADALNALTPATQDEVAAIAALPELVRGYERIKLDNVERFRAEGPRLLAALRSERREELTR